MNFILPKSLLFLFLFFSNLAHAQIVINEGSNRNYSSIADEDGEFPDWIELYNAGSSTVQLLNYTLTDDATVPNKWALPNIELLPQEYKVVFCSGKDRKPISGFVSVLNETNYNPTTGWNTHNFTTPFYWDGVSPILMNICSYSSAGYTVNSVFNQSTTPYNSTISAFQDGSNNICQAQFGDQATMRPNVKFNNVTVGTGTQQNSPYDYPAPYGNWYWAARTQMIFPATELLAAGLTAGNITNLSFNIVSTDPNTVYDYIDFSMKLVAYTQVTSAFEAVDTSARLHTNFKIASAGETVYLYSPTQQLLSSLLVHCEQIDNSTGSFPDASTNVVLFANGTPESTNNSSQPYSAYLAEPTISTTSGFYNSPITVTLTNPNGAGSSIRYTLNGDDPDLNSTLYSGNPITFFSSSVLKAKAFSANELPSETAVATYFFGVSHVTPILSVITDDENLYGANGIFDNWQFDWEKAAYVEYFDSTQQLIFSQRAGMQIDGGAGGSRSHPQHSFRVELDDPVLGEGSINHLVIPNRSSRTKFSKFYLRNGSNYYLSLPHKDAAHLEGMAAETNNYYSAWRPITVYINGAYFGLYELREKFDAEYFEELENADPDSLDILSLSYWNGSVLRAVEGSVDNFYNAYNAFNSLNTNAPNFWNNADQYFDMTYYADYIIAETWAGNVDWPHNNIKIYRSNATDFRWRFCIIDLEGGFNPNGFSSAYDDHIGFVLGADPNNPFINVFLKSIQNPRFKNYFINRYADLMNTSYQYSRLSSVANSMFQQTVIEMPNEYLRWGDPNNIGGQMADFYNNQQTFLSEMAIRTTEVRNDIQNNFALNGQVDVTLDVFPAGAGQIKISTIIPENLPWTGVYFNGNPVQITAIPNIGYEFVQWDINALVNSIDTNISILQNIPANSTYLAVFAPLSVFGNVTISEINYNSDSTRDAGDWVEFVNHGNAPINLSNWKFSDNASTYTFPQGTILQAGEYLVLAEDATQFNAQFPNITVLGNTGFGFSSSGETLTLSDNNNVAVVSVPYQSVSPWTAAANGIGRTLERTNFTNAPTLASSWFAGCVGGSPKTAFVPCSEAIIFSEINYNSSDTADAGDWVELWNTSNAAVNISGWQFSDGDDTHLFTIPANTILQSQGRIVLAGDATLFQNRFPTVTNYVGSFGFGLSSNGEAIRLFDNSGKLYQSLVYDEAAPWAQGANGNGYTLELIDENGNLCEGSNWQDGCPEGSPSFPFSTPCFPVNTTEAKLDEAAVVVFPNPTTGIFNVQLTNNSIETTDFSVEVFNYTGQKVAAKTATNGSENISFDLNSCAKGVYLTKITVNQKFVYKLIVLQ